MCGCMLCHWVLIIIVSQRYFCNDRPRFFSQVVHCHFQNLCNWIEEHFSDFVWCLDKKTRLELDPQTESFVVELHTDQGLRIVRQNMVKVISIYMCRKGSFHHCLIYWSFPSDIQKRCWWRGSSWGHWVLPSTSFPWGKCKTFHLLLSEHQQCPRWMHIWNYSAIWSSTDNKQSSTRLVYS